MVHLVATVHFEEADSDVAAMLCSAAFAMPSGQTISCQ